MLLSVRHRLEYSGFRASEALFSSLPVERASALSGAIWQGVAPHMFRHARALSHLKAALPDTTPTERQAISLQMWNTLGRVFGESFHLEDIARHRVDLADADQWARELAPSKGRGCVICAPHLGNWEVAAASLMRIGLKTAGIYQPITNRLVEARVRQLREPLYPGGLFAKSQATTRSLYRHIKSGGSFALLADLRDRAGIRVPFFGREALSTRFPAMLARQLDVPLLVGRVVRLPDVHFQGTLELVDMPRTADPDADIWAATAAIQAKFETWIRAEPGQWMWAHKRWD